MSYMYVALADGHFDNDNLILHVALALGSVQEHGSSVCSKLILP